MSKLPDLKELTTTLADAWSSHSKFQHDYLNDVHDEMWPGWYSAYVVGRHGEFMPTSDLARVLEAVTDEKDWTASAAAAVLRELNK